MAAPVVAIVGRSNVGKSTLLNRIVGHRSAIVEQTPGVTRDRKEVEADWLGRSFRLVDTGGWVAGGTDLDDKVSRQSERAVAEADLVLFVVDVTVGVTEEDGRVAELLRRSGKPVVLLANKVDDAGRENQVWELLSLGLGDPVPISALHGRGTGDLLDEVVARLPAEDVQPGTEAAAAAVAAREHGGPRVESAGHPLGAEGSGAPARAGRETGTTAAGRTGPGGVGDATVPEGWSDEAGKAKDVVAVAIVGRPNVGKSTLFNRLIGDERSVVHDVPGTTRDVIDTLIETELGPLRLVDTAGMRRRSRISEGTEYYSLVRALEAVDAADVALLVVDANEGVTGQDQRLAERVDAAGCPIVVLLNKWDQLDAEQRAEVRWQVGAKLAFVGEAPVLPISALSGRGVHKLFPALEASVEAYRRRVPTSRVNTVIHAAQQAHPAPAGARVLYAMQGATDPPTFTLFANRELPRTYLRYIERKLREAFDLGSTPVKLRVRRRGS